MDWAAIGSISLGIVIGYISMFFITRTTDFSPTNLAAFIGVMIGGAAIEFLADQIEAKAANYGLYAFGLLAGLVAYVVIYWLRNGHGPTILGMSLGGPPNDQP